jgi:hypothetical protein
MKKFQDYIAETEEWINTPVPGDEIDFELAPDSLLETYVVETVEDGVIIEADDQALALLEQHGVLVETIRTYGAVGRAGTGQTYYEADSSETDKHDKEQSALDRLQELAGLPIEEDQAADVVAAKELETDITNPMPGVHEAADEEMEEAKYHDREVPLGKPMQGDVKKFKVYVRDPQTGNVKKVNFGDKTMRIKKSNPARRKSFRARHRCSNPGPRTKARYWSCRKW